MGMNFASSREHGAESRRFCSSALLPLMTFAVVAIVGSSVAHAQIGLWELARFNISSTSGTANPEFIGSNPAAVGWNGSKLYVAGQNGSATTANTSIIEITNASSVWNGTSGSATGFLTPVFSSTFGTIASPASRGYTGLAMNGSQLGASLDLGSNSPNGIQMFDGSTNTRLWNLSATGTSLANVGTTRGYAGPDFDPGYQGVSGQGSGLGWLTQGSGRRLLNNPTNGLPIYTSATNAALVATYPTVALGMVMNTNPISSTWRDTAFNPANGDLYTRNQNGVTRANRTGANSDENPLDATAGQSALIWAQPTPGNNVLTNIGFMNAVSASTNGPFTNSYTGDVLVFNNRSSTASGQAWTDVIQFTTTSGSSITPTWNFISTPATGNAGYDFEWDSASKTLAVVDYANRNVSIFSTAVPEPSTTAVLVAASVASGLVLTRRRSAARR